MKTKILLLTSVFVLSTSIAFSTTLTVSNHPLGGAQYSSLQAAYNAAANGDTLIIEGTNINYSFNYGLLWSKSLTVIGAGLNTDKQFFKKTYIAYPHYTSPFRLTTGSDGSSFYGIVFLQHVDLYANTNNITFENCEFRDYLQTNNYVTTNLTLRNCIFSRDNNDDIFLPSSVPSSVLILNCVFDGYIQGYNNLLNVVMIENCLFLSTSSSIINLHYATISNCVFMNNFPAASVNCIYLNNICRVAGTFPPAGNTGSGNIENTDPNFVSYTAGSLYSPSHDYNLQSGSPCVATGVGGTDIGVHGGITATFSETGEALIAPVVRSMQINNTTVAPNGTINVEISASKPTDN